MFRGGLSLQGATRVGTAESRPTLDIAMSKCDRTDRAVARDGRSVFTIPATTAVAGPVGGSSPGAIGPIGAGGSVTIPIESALGQLIEGYLLGDLESMANEVTLKEIGAVGYPMVMAVLSGSELLAALATDEKKDNRIETYWTRYMAKVDVRYGDLGRIACQLARHGIAHSYLSHFGVLVVRGQPGLHLSLWGGEVVFDCVELYEHFRESYTQHARPYLLKHAVDAQRRLDALLQHDRVKASSLIGRLPAARFPECLVPVSMPTTSMSASGGVTLATPIHVRGSNSSGGQSDPRPRSRRPRGL